ncbi:hypothetical protein [Sorangium sp. So ce1335]|uniref:hypothetical protein n=1 Tax=Sorangium sp. So ce1335 TaxID=3133335 RepID=UPI003F618739
MRRPARISRGRGPALAVCAAALGWPLAAGAAPEGPREAVASERPREVAASAGPREVAASERPREVAVSGSATEPDIRLTLPWLLLQLVPSPELWIGPSGTRFGLRWQVTPLLYSFGINRKLSPWRAFVVEPLTRHAGSIELFGSPGYVAGSGAAPEGWTLRGGVRAYFPLLDHGETLSCSLGGSALYARAHTQAHTYDRLAASYEAGIYTLFGGLGAQVTVTPTAALRSTTITLSLRYF